MIVLKKQDLLKSNNLKLIGETLRSAKLVIFPTETVYGIGANALDDKAVKKIYQAKGRPSDNPLIIHIASKEDVKKYSKSISNEAKKLIDHFWPGPLTLIFKKNKVVPLATTGGLNSVAIRMPSDKIALKVIKAAKVPIAAPSANLSGKPTSTMFKHVLQDFKNKVDIIIDGGDTQIGLESTVVDTSGKKLVLLRPGYISKSMIEKVIGKPIIDKSEIVRSKVKSPGMKYRHYKPKGKLFIIDAEAKKMANYVESQKLKLKSKKIAVICEDEFKNLFKVKVKTIGSIKNKKLIAHNLYAALREMDYWNIDYIYIHHLGNSQLAKVMMNRLNKAADETLILK